METKYAEIFINAWSTVIESFSSKHIKSADVEAPDENLKRRDVYVLMGMVGDINGQIFMAMDAQTGKALTSEMLGGMEITEVDEVVISAVGELCNMIMGNACSSISDDNAGVNITPPTVIADQNMPQLKVRPLYNISFLLEDLEKIDFHVAVMCNQR